MLEIESEEKDRVLNDYEKRKLNSDEINAYPDLRILTRNGDTSTFNSERTVPKLVEWIEANVTPLQTPHRKTPKTRSGGGKFTRKSKRRGRRRGRGRTRGRTSCHKRRRRI
jgi:hypothetical protein